ncbi:MAG: PIN domain-containing protein [Nanoarchaeota archaeon]
MEQIDSFFFDTYALFEVIEGNPNYEKYTKGISIITSKLNLMELHYGLLRIESKEIANKYYDYYLKFAIDFSDDDIKKANELKLHMKKQNVSYVDCLGYILARRLGILFLTGDCKFEGLENVEFVK